jgi:hypothetical protein
MSDAKAGKFCWPLKLRELRDNAFDKENKQQQEEGNGDDENNEDEEQYGDKDDGQREVNNVVAVQTSQFSFLWEEVYGFIAVFAYLYRNVLCLLHVLIGRSISLTSIHQRLRCRQSWKLFKHNDHRSLFC